MTLEFRIQRWRNGAEASWCSEACGVMTDFAQPDRDSVESKVDARHSGALGALVGEVVSHVTCHLNSVTPAARMLYNPTSPLHLPQKTCRNLPANAWSMASALAFSLAPDTDVENCMGSVSKYPARDLVDYLSGACIS